MHPMSSPSQKKRKAGSVSALAGEELAVAYNSLEKLRKMMDGKGDVSLDGVDASDPEAWLDTVLTMMKSKMDAHRTYSFSAMTGEDLSTMGFLQCPVPFELKSVDDSSERASKARELGDNDHWSSQGLYRHLCMLEGHVPRSSKASCRMWIDAVFFRAIAMSSPEKKLVLRAEYPIKNIPLHSSQDAIGGYVDYIAAMVSPKEAAKLLDARKSQPNQLSGVFFVCEAKAPGDLPAHIPQAVFEMYACAQRINRKTIIRGALTDGRNWMFMILKINKTVSYAISRELSIGSNEYGGRFVVTEMNCDLIAGIVVYWIEHADEDIGADDWFEMIEWESAVGEH